MSEPHSQSKSTGERTLSSRERGLANDSRSTQPLSSDEIEKLLRLSRENVLNRTKRGPIEELGPGDVQYLRGDSVDAQDYGHLPQSVDEVLKDSLSPESLLEQAEHHLAEAILDSDPQRAAETNAKTDLRIEPRLTTANSMQGLTLDDLSEIELDISIELGRAELLIDDVLKLREGSVVALDKLAGDPVDIVANGRLVARGELLVVDGKFGVRLSEVL